MILNEIDGRSGYTEQMNVKKILRGLAAGVDFNDAPEIKIHLIQ